MVLIFQFLRNFLVSFALLFCVCGCINRSESGYIFEQEAIDKMSVGMSKNDILEIMGEPTFTGADSKDPNWYYVWYQKKSFVFLRPKIVKAKILSLSFSGDVLAKIDFSSEKNMKNIRVLVSEVKPRK